MKLKDLIEILEQKTTLLKNIKIKNKQNEEKAEKEMLMIVALTTLNYQIEKALYEGIEVE